MNINLNHVFFRIKRYQNRFAILVTYENHSFYIFKGTMFEMKKEFMLIVQNRERLMPYIQYYFSNHAVA